MLASVGASQGEEVLDNVFEAVRFGSQDGQRLTIFLRRAIRLGKSYIRLTAQNRHRRAQFVRCVRYKPALLIKGLVEPAQQTGEGLRQRTEFILGDFDRKPHGQVDCADASCRESLGGYRRE